MNIPFCSYQDKTRKEMPRGVIVGFPNLTAAGLQKMKEELSLSMTLAELRICQKYYRNRAPLTVDELYFLDAFVRGKHSLCDVLSVSELFLDDSDAMETYRDLMEKKALVGGLDNLRSPALSELLSVLPKTLLRSGRAFDTGDAISVFEWDSALSLAASGYPFDGILSVKESELPLYAFHAIETARPLWKEKAAEHDAILLISRSVADDEGFLGRVVRFAASDLYKESVRAIRPIGACGLASALTSLANGAYVELHRIPAVFDMGELYDLATAEIGGLLLALPQDKAFILLREAGSHGLSGAQIARAMSGEHLTVRREGASPFGVQAKLLCELSEERIPFTFRANPASIDSLSEIPEISFLLIGDRVYSSAALASHTFCGGAYASLAAVLGAVIFGESDSTPMALEAYGSCGSMTSLRAGRLLSAMLGAYRTFAELAVPCRTAVLPRRENGSDLQRIVCTAPASPSSPLRKFSKNGSRVYLISVGFVESGLPDYSEARKIVKLIGALRNAGRLFSAAIGCGGSLSECASEMCGEYTFSPCQNPYGDRIDGVFALIETDAVLEGISPVGRTVFRDMSSEAEP